MKSAIVCGLIFLNTAPFWSQIHERIMWKVAPFEHRVFIENIGQFDGVFDPSVQQVEYVICNTNEYILFTTGGVIIAHPQYLKDEEKAVSPIASQSKSEHLEESYHLRWHYTSMLWQAANQQPVIEPGLPVEEQFTFATVGSEPFRCRAFRTLIYRNVYPGIDVKYSFHHETGLKYDVVVHPGADASKLSVQILSNGHIRLDEKGNLLIPTVRGLATDAAPVAYYRDNGQPFAAHYSLDGNVLMFNLGVYDVQREVVIDPWLVTPGFTQADVATDVERNTITGDIYVYGGTPQHQIRKFTSIGTPVWTYFVPINFNGNFYGDLELGPDGNLYFCDGFATMLVYKLNESTQTLAWLNIGFLENWRLQYNSVSGYLVVGGTNQDTNENLKNLNTTNGTTMGVASVATGNGIYLREIRGMHIDTNGDIYGLHCSPYGALSAGSNRLSRTGSDLTNIWQVQSGLLLPEEGAFYAYNSDISYCSDSQCFHGINGLATSDDYVYVYDGKKLLRRNKSNGSLVNQVQVADGVSQECSGTYVDTCGYVYVGTMQGISKFSPDLVLADTYTIGTEVYDIIKGQPAEIIVSGNGFLASVAMDCGLFAVVNPTHVLCTGQCTGAASLQIFGGMEPVNIQWSTGSTAPSIQNLCAGSYSVTVTDNVGNVVTQNFTINEPAPLAATYQLNEPQCHGGCDGSIALTVTGGHPTYTYTWNTTPVQNTATAEFLCAGNYQCTVTDFDGCLLPVAVSLGQPASIELNIIIQNCTDDKPNGSALAVATQGTPPYNFVWQQDPTLTNGAPLLENLYTGNYLVEVFDANNCHTQGEAVIPACNDTLFIPNIFTPNGDALNADFLIYNKGYNDFHGWIYNRWGQVMYEWTDGNSGWNGKTKSGDACAEGVYYYIMRAVHYTGTPIERSGYFHLVSRKD